MIKFPKKRNILIEKKDLFAGKSKNWDMSSRRVQGAKKIANGIIKNITLDKNMHIMDFGAGTGLLSYFLSNSVGKITAIDISPSMLTILKKKSHLFNCDINILKLDLIKENSPTLFFDGVVSSMTFHHVKDILNLLKKIYNILPNDGFIAIADLYKENGTFHNDNNGVFHFGFDIKELKKNIRKVGFSKIQFETINTISKPNGDFPVFLMIATK